MTSPIIGPRTRQQLLDAVQALTVNLTAEDYQRLDAIAPPGRATVPYYVRRHDMGDVGAA